jgi:hypothetical protein
VSAVADVLKTMDPAALRARVTGRPWWRVSVIIANDIDVAMLEFGSIAPSLPVSLRVCPGEVSISRRQASSLRSVSHVVSLGAEREMPNVATRGIVARMPDLQSGRNRTVRQLPSHSVSLSRPAIDADLSVASPIGRPDPYVALIGRSESHLVPEPICNRDSAARMETVAAAQTANLASISTNSRRCRGEGRSAVCAVSRDRIWTHRKYIPSGATSPAVRAARGLSCAGIIP